MCGGLREIIEMSEKEKIALKGFGLREILEAVSGELILGNPGDCFHGVSIDSRTVKKGEIFIAIKGDRYDGHNFIAEAVAKGAGCIIARRNNVLLLGSKLPQAVVMVKDTLCALSSLAYYHRKRFGIPVIGITGSNGKTTTKEMLSALLSSRYNVLKNEGTQNNLIGVSLTLLRLNPKHDIAVLEFGTNHFGEIQELARVAAPNMGIITNIGPAHLEFFGDERGVLREKWGLIEELAWPRIAVLNADDSLLREKINNCPQDIRCFTFGFNNPADFLGKKAVCRNKKLSFWVKNYRLKLKTCVRINAYNALAAYAASRIFSLDAYDIINKFGDFKFPDARFQAKNIRGIEVIDDAYNANPVSLGCALDAFRAFPAKGRKIAVIADMLELGGKGEILHRKAGVDLVRSKIDFIIGVGRLSHIACDEALSEGFNPKSVCKCDSVSDARHIIRALAKKGDTVLLKGSRGMRLEEIFK